MKILQAKASCEEWAYLTEPNLIRLETFSLHIQQQMSWNPLDYLQSYNVFTERRTRFVLTSVHISLIISEICKNKNLFT
jgi:hypothetical protein